MELVGKLLYKLTILGLEIHGKIEGRLLNLLQKIPNPGLDLGEQLFLLGRHDNCTSSRGLLHDVFALETLALEPGGVGILGFEMTVLNVGELVKQQRQSLHVDYTLFIDVALGLWKDCLVDVEHEGQGALVDMQMRKIRKEIVTNKESHKDEIVNDTLHVEWEAESTRLF